MLGRRRAARVITQYLGYRVRGLVGHSGSCRGTLDGARRDRVAALDGERSGGPAVTAIERDHGAIARGASGEDAHHRDQRDRLRHRALDDLPIAEARHVAERGAVHHQARAPARAQRIHQRLRRRPDVALRARRDHQEGGLPVGQPGAARGGAEARRQGAAASARAAHSSTSTSARITADRTDHGRPAVTCSPRTSSRCDTGCRNRRSCQGRPSRRCTCHCRACRGNTSSCRPSRDSRFRARWDRPGRSPRS